MAIDLSTPEGRSSYLNDKLSDLINGVDSTYGNIIFEELLKRIDSTIKDFNTYHWNTSYSTWVWMLVLCKISRSR